MAPEQIIGLLRQADVELARAVPWAKSAMG